MLTLKLTKKVCEMGRLKNKLSSSSKCKSNDNIGWPKNPKGFGLYVLKPLHIKKR